jgi:hypothetical protein
VQKPVLIQRKQSDNVSSAGLTSIAMEFPLRHVVTILRHATYVVMPLAIKVVDIRSSLGVRLKEK